MNLRKKTIKAIYFLIIFFSSAELLAQKNADLVRYEVMTHEITLRNFQLDSLLDISISKLKNSDLKHRVISYSLFVSGKADSPTLRAQINTYYVQLDKPEFLGSFVKEGVRIYCFGERLKNFVEVSNGTQENVSYHYQSELKLSIDSNLIDERIILKGKTEIKNVIYTIAVESLRE